MCGPRKSHCHHHTGDHVHHAASCHVHSKVPCCCCGYSAGPLARCIDKRYFHHGFEHQKPDKRDTAREVENIKAYLNNMAQILSSLEARLREIDEDKEEKCEHPEKLKGKEPGDCSDKQIKECHGEEALKDDHCCE